MSLSEELQHIAAGDFLRRGDEDRTAVYRVFDSLGALLYVGMTGSPTNRWTEHSSDKLWWREAASWTVTWFATREEARGAELVAIEAEHPRYNIADNPNRAPRTDRDEEVQRVLDTIDALGDAEAPAARAKRLTQLLDAMPGTQAKVREMRQQAVIEMKDSGMSLRAIAAELGISFGRVRDIIEGVTNRRKPKKEPPAEQ